MLVNQYGAFNSPEWFNCGLWHAYGISGSGGNWAWNMERRPPSAEEGGAPQRNRSAKGEAKDDAIET